MILESCIEGKDKVNHVTCRYTAQRIHDLESSNFRLEFCNRTLGLASSTALVAVNTSMCFTDKLTALMNH